MDANKNGSVQNLSFVLESVNQVTYEDRPIPELKDPHDVLLNVRYTGICGSDVSTNCPAQPIECLLTSFLSIQSGSLLGSWLDR